MRHLIKVLPAGSQHSDAVTAPDILKLTTEETASRGFAILFQQLPSSSSPSSSCHPHKKSSLSCLVLPYFSCAIPPQASIKLSSGAPPHVSMFYQSCLICSSSGWSEMKPAHIKCECETIPEEDDANPPLRKIRAAIAHF